MTVTAADVEAAAHRLGAVVTRTPLERCERLSEQLGLQVWLKREDVQVVRSYKLRGAYNLMVGLDDAQRAAGVVCASAGNHAQGVAFGCRALDLQGRIYLPGNTPRQKLERVAAIGGDAVTIVVHGDSYDEANAEAIADCARTGSTLVPPFDDERTIAGQGTVAVEVIDQLGRPADAFVVPVGGGGLIAGIAAWCAERSPSTVVIGAEPLGAASMQAALDAGGPVRLVQVDTFVDGAAVREVGALTFPLVRDHVSRVVSVDEGAVCTEMLALYQVEGVIAEPAGALATTALPLLDLAPGSTVVCIVSGGNNDVSRYGDIVERSLVHRGLKHYFLVEFPQEPGALRRFLDEVLGPDDDITLFEYVKKSNREVGPALIGIELSDREDLTGLLARMEDSSARMELILPGSPLFTFLL